MPQSLPESVAGSAYLRCSSGGIAYGVPLSRVRSVDRPEKMEWNSQPSGPEGWLPGATERVPVFGIAHLLQASRERTSFGALVQLRGNHGAWALGFDRVERFDTQVEENSIWELPALIRSEARPSLRGVVSAGEDVILCLNVLSLEAQRLSPGQPQPIPQALPPTIGSTRASQPLASASPRDARTQVVRFWLPGIPDSFGLSARQVIEFVTSAPATVIPRANPSVPAVAIWRDRAVPVVDLGRAMALAQAPSKVERLLIVQASGPTGLIAIPTGGAMPRLQSANEFRACSNPAGFELELLHGVFEDPNGRMAMPNLDRILNGAQ